VIGADGGQVGVISRAEALQMAAEAEMDLVEVSPTAEPPVCRIMDYGKFLFEQNKKAHSAKRKQKQIQIKEVKFRPGTEEADYVRRAAEFLKNQGLRVETDLRNEKVGFKIREHTLQRVPYLLVAGDRESGSNSLAVRTRNGKDLGAMSLETIAARLAEEVASRGRITLEV
jgi:translation initiation factor IF-3